MNRLQAAVRKGPTHGQVLDILPSIQCRAMVHWCSGQHHRRHPAGPQSSTRLIVVRPPSTSVRSSSAMVYKGRYHDRTNLPEECGHDSSPPWPTGEVNRSDRWVKRRYPSCRAHPVRTVSRAPRLDRPSARRPATGRALPLSPPATLPSPSRRCASSTPSRPWRARGPRRAWLANHGHGIVRRALSDGSVHTRCMPPRGPRSYQNPLVSASDGFRDNVIVSGGRYFINQHIGRM